jgi:hypothetical protein
MASMEHWSGGGVTGSNGCKPAPFFTSSAASFIPAGPGSKKGQSGEKLASRLKTEMHPDCV